MERVKINMKGFKFRKVTCYQRGEVDPSDIRVGDIITIANKDMTVSHVGLVGCEDPETISAAITHPELRSIDEDTLYQRIILEPCD